MSIEETRIRRVEKEPDTGRWIYALEFVNMNSKEARALSQFVFQCEIDRLRRRALSVALEGFDS